jgi:hypothetical protein
MDANKMNKVYISDVIQNLLVTSKRWNAELFLLGENRNGVITKAVRLAKYLGCEDMPGVAHRTLHKAYLELLKDKTLPIAFGYRTTHEDLIPFEEKEKFGKMLFICSVDGALIAEKITTCDELRRFEVCVVSEKFVPSSTRSTTPTRVRSALSTNKKKEKIRGNRKR